MEGDVDELRCRRRPLNVNVQHSTFAASICLEQSSLSLALLLTPLSGDRNSYEFVYQKKIPMR